MRNQVKSPIKLFNSGASGVSGASGWVVRPAGVSPLNSSRLEYQIPWAVIKMDRRNN